MITIQQLVETISPLALERAKASREEDEALIRELEKQGALVWDTEAFDWVVKEPFNADV